MQVDIRILFIKSKTGIPHSFVWNDEVVLFLLYRFLEFNNSQLTGRYSYTWGRDVRERASVINLKWQERIGPTSSGDDNKVENNFN